MDKESILDDPDEPKAAEEDAFAEDSDEDTNLRPPKKLKRQFVLDEFFDFEGPKSKKKSRSPQPGPSSRRDDDEEEDTESSQQSSISSASTTGGSSSLHPLFDGKFFSIKTKDAKTIHATCTLCQPLTVCIKGSLAATSNFLKHMRKKHSGSLELYNKYKTEKKQQQLETQSLEQSQTTQRKMKQTTLIAKPKKQCSQKEFDEKIVKFVVNTMSPTSIIEHDEFKDLFCDLSITVMSRRTLVRRIDEKFIESTTYIKRKIQDLKYVCTTADIWSSKKRSFLGVTCHWINLVTLERESVALACRRFTDSHTHDKIADMLENILIEFGITENQITSTITDNGSNFVKAFKEFERRSDSLSVQDYEDEEDDEDSPLDDDSSEEYEAEDITVKHPRLHLPKHLRCASHTLNLMATTDAKNAINSVTTLRSRHEKILQKCNALWIKARKPKSAEVIQNVLGHTLSYPAITRWNSFYDSISQIIAEKQKLKELSQKLEIKESFKETELNYLEEYCAIMGPIARTLDFLQGEKKTYFGYLLPSLLSLKIKLDKLKEQTQFLRNTITILEKLSQSLKTRFAKYFSVTDESRNAIVAAVTIPSIKLKWFNLFSELTGLTQKDVETIIITAAIRLVDNDSEIQEENAENRDSPNIEDDSFFEFDKPLSSTAVVVTAGDLKNKVQLEILRYLEDRRTEISVLDEFPVVRKLFVKYNTDLPSSAPVERLFSFATFIDTPRRNATSDSLFEKLVLMKANKV